MKNILLILFIFISITNIYAEWEVEKFLSVQAIEDSLKINFENKTDTTNNSAADSPKKMPVKKIIHLSEQGLVDSTFQNNILHKKNLNKTDYRYTGNFISQTHFGFIRDFGNVGQPAEVLIYGHGFSGSTYLADGINITNRLTNSYDLNLFQSESIDRIELIPLVQGFLYGSNNNPAAINFISSEFQGNIPYTRIKFYQGIYDEGFFDGIFNSTISNKISLSAEITNQSAGQRYDNSGQSAWLASARLRYILSDKINFIAGYSYAKTNTPLNGGVNLDSIISSSSTENIEDILYNNIQAPVNYINKYQKVTSHNFYFKTLADIIPQSPTSLTFYYQDVLNEFRQNDSTSKSNLQSNVAAIMNNNSYKTIGMNINQVIKLNSISLRTIAGYEHNKFVTPLILNDLDINSAWLTAQMKFSLFDNKITSSVFAKYLKCGSNNLNGYGADFSFNIINGLNVYAGYSEYERPYSNFWQFSTADDFTSKSFEAAVSYNDEVINFRTGYFISTNYDAAIPILTLNTNENSTKNESTFFIGKDDVTTSGANIKIDIKFWKLLLTTNSSYYFSKAYRDKTGLPEFIMQGGIYYIDTLFNSNLKLNAGINYSSIGNRNNLYYDFEKSISTTHAGIIDAVSGSIKYLPHSSILRCSKKTLNISSDFQIDLFVAGQIQDNATIYFTFENILNNKYYLIPYYPMYERGMRFGVAWEFFN